MFFGEKMLLELTAIEILRITNELNTCRVCGAINKKTLTNCGFCDSTDLVEWDTTYQSCFELLTEAPFKVTYGVFTEDE